MGEVKKLMMETEAMLVTCLDEWSMTNEQAFTKIGKELGYMAKHHARDLVNQWSKGDQDGDCKI